MSRNVEFAGTHNAPDNAARMIPKPETPPHPPAWQRALLESFSDPRALLAALDLDPVDPRIALDPKTDFPLRVTRSFVSRMRRGDPLDPLFRQVWPHQAEQNRASPLPLDAVGDLAKTQGGGVIHKYHGRVLLIATGACAIHCRYCFRRHFPYAEHLAARQQWQPALDIIAADPSIEEVILSGGDPLSLSDAKLATLVADLEQIPHLQRLRIHTRQPIVLPQRVDTHLLAWLGSTRLQTVMVLHVNHAHEIDAEVSEGIARLRSTGIHLLNQSVLLRGINDDVEGLSVLSQSLFAQGVLPYYLHLLDRVPGVMHFDVSEVEALSLMRKLSQRLPGYLVPRLVREEAGQPAKTLLAFSTNGGA